MLKTYISYNNVFWTNESVDKPSKSYLDNITWQEVDYDFNVNDNKLTFYTGDDRIRLVKVVNENKNETRYYHFEKREWNKTNYTLTFNLDYWLTYTLVLTQENISILCERHQDYDDIGKLNFDVLESDYSYKYKTIKTHNENKSEDNNFTIDSSDLFNGVYCFVFNDSPNNSWMFLPVLSNSDDVIVESKIDTTITNEIETHHPHLITPNNKYSIILDEKNIDKQLIDFNRRGYNIEKQLCVNVNGIRQLLDKETFNFTSDDEYTKYYWDVINDNNKIIIEKHLQKDGSRINRFEYILPAGADWKDVYFNFVIVNGNKPYKFKVNNTFSNLLTVVNNSKFSSNFMGVYIIPNFINLYNNFNFLTITPVSSGIPTPPLNLLNININEYGVKIPKIKLIDNLKIDKNYKFNSTIPLDEVIYKYYDCYWYNNKIDISKMINNECVNVSGNFNFTNSFNLKLDNDLLSPDNSVIEFPSQQPFRSDEFKKYVINNMNSVNTGYAIQKQQNIINTSKGVLNSVLGGVIGSSISGNPLGIVSGAGGVLNSLTGGILGIQNYEKQIKSKYSDLDNQLGNKLLFGTTLDSMWGYYINDNYNHETLIIKEPSEKAIISFNNQFLLNGVYNPKFLTLNNLPNSTSHLGFKYVKIDSKYINTIFSSYINDSIEVKEMIFSQLQEFRIWDKIPEIK